MKCIFSILILFLAFSMTTLFAQTNSRTEIDDNNFQDIGSKSPDEQKPSIKEKLFFGGYANFSFGTYLVIGVEPLVGYQISNKLSAGIKLKYDYISDRRYSETINTSTYGAGIFTRLSLYKGLYAHAEYAGYNFELYDYLGASEREWIPFLFLGGGMSSRVGNNATMYVQILFDVIQHENSPYGRTEPFYSIGVSVGL